MTQQLFAHMVMVARFSIISHKQRKQKKIPENKNVKLRKKKNK